MPKVLKISIALTSTQLVGLRAAIKTGGYATISEVIREAIRHWQSTRTVRKTRSKIKRIKNKIKKSHRKTSRKSSRKSRPRKKKKL